MVIKNSSRLATGMESCLSGMVGCYGGRVSALRFMCYVFCVFFFFEGVLEVFQGFFTFAFARLECRRRLYPRFLGFGSSILLLLLFA